jgi:hypothetical protein
MTVSSLMARESMTLSSRAWHLGHRIYLLW